MSEEKKQELKEYKKEYQKKIEKQKTLKIINKILRVYFLFIKLFFIINVRFDFII